MVTGMLYDVQPWDISLDASNITSGIIDNDRYNISYLNFTTTIINNITNNITTINNFTSDYNITNNFTTINNITNNITQDLTPENNNITDLWANASNQDGRIISIENKFPSNNIYIYDVGTSTYIRSDNNSHYMQLNLIGNGINYYTGNLLTDNPLINAFQITPDGTMNINGGLIGNGLNLTNVIHLVDELNSTSINFSSVSVDYTDINSYTGRSNLNNAQLIMDVNSSTVTADAGIYFRVNGSNRYMMFMDNSASDSINLYDYVDSKYLFISSSSGISFAPPGGNLYLSSDIADDFLMRFRPQGNNSDEIHLYAPYPGHIADGLLLDADSVRDIGFSPYFTMQGFLGTNTHYWNNSFIANMYAYNITVNSSIQGISKNVIFRNASNQNATMQFMNGILTGCLGCN